MQRGRFPDPAKPRPLYRQPPGTAPAGRDVLGWINAGQLKLRVEHVYPLAQAATAQAALAGRQTTGKVVLETA